MSSFLLEDVVDELERDELLLEDDFLLSSLLPRPKRDITPPPDFPLSSFLLDDLVDELDEPKRDELLLGDDFLLSSLLPRPKRDMTPPPDFPLSSFLLDDLVDELEEPKREELLDDDFLSSLPERENREVVPEDDELERNEEVDRLSSSFELPKRDELELEEPKREELPELEESLLPLMPVLKRDEPDEEPELDEPELLPNRDDPGRDELGLFPEEDTGLMLSRIFEDDERMELSSISSKSSGSGYISSSRSS